MLLKPETPHSELSVSPWSATPATLSGISNTYPFQVPDTQQTLRVDHSVCTHRCFGVLAQTARLHGSGPQFGTPVCVRGLFHKCSCCSVQYAQPSPQVFARGAPTGAASSQTRPACSVVEAAESPGHGRVRAFPSFSQAEESVRHRGGRGGTLFPPQ